MAHDTLKDGNAMNVGILTFHFSDNYGAALQAYALRRWLMEQGHRASFIDYRPAHIEHGGRLSLPTSPARLKANLKIVYLAVSSFINQHFGNQGQKEKFVRFRERFLGVKVNDAPTDNGASLAAANAFDLIVAGSDQIWSPSQHFGFDPNYFLAFAQSFRARKISYAASFGRDRVSSSEAAQLPQLLRNFDAISVRETSGVTLVERATGHKPGNVPDPTLLHSNYAELTDPASSAHDGPYVFCYGLRSPDNIRQTADLASRQLACPILSPHNPHRRWTEIGNTVYPDPGEWVALIKNARFVVTNSFHGTVFSLLFKKPFIVAGLTGEKASANARAINLLRAVGLESRFAPSFSAQNTQALMAREIDWAAVDQRLAEMRQAGNTFLSTQLKATTP
ncbi:MAG: hypothetical protein DCF26_17030 [Burkholderiales bacterium]|nr:MAG: hypothetical protein DCF26_17030 [Burkholderiales bacterium]